MMIAGFIASALAMTTPILLAALGELIVEQGGMINIGIEGAMLAGSFFGLAAAWSAGSLIIGMAAAIAAGIAFNAIFAAISVNLAVNQVVAGTAIDILALGLTGVLYQRIFGITGGAFTITPMRPLPSGPLAHIPFAGRALFSHTPLVYLAFALVPVVHHLLTRTRWGLELRAAGEHPAAADALGLRVYRLRWEALLIAGLLSGLAGGYLTMAYTDTFVEGITAGRGYVALAVVIVGRWRAWGVAAAALLFGAASALQFVLQAFGSTLPYQLFLAIPYALTLVVLVLARGSAQSPSALGEPYVRT
jgi:simple sugar transport system permease protein